MVVAHDVLHLLDRIEATINDEVEVWEGLFELEDPRVLERRDRPILLRVEAFEVRLTRMHDEFLAGALGADDSNEILDVLPLVEVVDAQAALDRDWNRALRLHLCDDTSHQRWVLHEHSPECTLLDFIRRTSTVDIDLIVAEFFHDFRSFAHSHGVVTAQLTHYRMLII